MITMRSTKWNPTYHTWRSIKSRCRNPNSPNYPSYGGAGVTMCDRWFNSFEAFVEDMGDKPKGTTIDRIKHNVGYQPGNCRWADSSTQNKNRRPFKRTSALPEPMRYISHIWGNTHRIKIKMPEGIVYVTCKTLEEAQAQRDILVFERDFLLANQLY